VKSCGSGAAVLALSWRECPTDDGGKTAVLREEHEVSRKAIAQGRPECSSCPVCSCAVLFAQIARGTAGAASIRSSLRPLFFGRANEDAKLGRSAPRDREVIFNRHHPRKRVTQYSRDSSDRIDRPRRTGSPAPVRNCAQGGGRRPGLCSADYEAASDRNPPASTRQRNSGESGGGASSGVQPVTFSSA
jgi:hypothetical protein